MKREYEMPIADILDLSQADIMSGSGGLSLGETGRDGGSISFDEWFTKLINQGTGSDGLEIDINDHLNGLS